MFEEEEEDEFEEETEIKKDSVAKVVETPKEDEKNQVLEGKRWSDGGYAYGYDTAEISRKDELKRALFKSRTPTKLSASSSGGDIHKQIGDILGAQKIAKQLTKKAGITASSFEIQDISTGHICPVAEDVVAIHNRTHIKFVFLRTGKSRLFVPAENKGVGVIGGRDDLSVLAWSDIGPPAPKIHVYRYADPLNIIALQGDGKLEYISLEFNHDSFLIGLSGVPDYKLTIWNWKTATKLHSISTEIRGPTNLSFSPHSGPKAPRYLLGETFDGQLSVWTIKRCGEDMRIVPRTIVDNDLLSKKHISATWSYPHFLFTLTRDGLIYKTDLEKRTTRPLLRDVKLEQLLSPEVQSNSFIKPHFEGLLLLLPRLIAVLRIEGVVQQASVLQTIEHPWSCFNFRDFFASYRYISWTPEGNIFHVQATENSVQNYLVWSKSEKRHYSAVAFLHPDDTHFASMEQNGSIHIFCLKTKEEVWKIDLKMKCTNLLSHPKLPILFVLTRDGRVIFVAIAIKTLPQAALQDEEEEEFSGDEELDIDEKPKDPIIGVTGNIFGEKRVQSHCLEIGEFDTMGNFFLVSGTEFGKIYLCDTQKDDVIGAGPATSREMPGRKLGGGGPGSRRMPKFKPSFAIDSTSEDSLEESPTEKPAEEPSKVKEDEGYFKICQSIRFDGRLLDMSFVQKTALCLCSTPSDEPGVVNESDRIKNSGDQVTILAIDKNAKTAEVLLVVTLKGRSSGICLSDNAKFFYAMIQRRKVLAKFKVPEQETYSNKISAVAKSKPTEHQLDLHRILKAKAKPGHLALFGRDGYFSYQAADIENHKPSSSVHLFHYDSGGVVRADQSTDGTIIVSNNKGSLQVFQPKESSRRPSAFPRSQSPLVPARLQSPSQLDPFIAKLMELPGLVPDPISIVTSWDDKQEEARVAQERKRYENDINEVSEELAAMRAKVAELLEENNKLPESERIDVHEFELDVEEQQKRVDEGLDKEDDLRLELKAWQMARQKVGQRIRKKVWDDMEVKGRSIMGIKESITVRNYPMTPMTFDEVDELQEVLNERKLALEVAKAASETITTPRERERSASISSSHQNQQAALQKLQNDNRLFGSRSYEFVDVSSCMLYSQLEVTTKTQAKQQIVLLQEVVRKLKNHFNKSFDEQYRLKADVMRQINDWRDSLKNVLSELGTMDKNEKAIIEKRLDWSPSEDPELDLPTAAPEDGAPIEEEDAEGKRSQFRKQRTIQSWEFEVEGDIAQPEFMASKSMVDYAPAEISAVEQYESMLSEQAERKAIRRRQLEVDRVDLKRKIREAVESFDAKLLDLYKKRLAIEKCILAEELKILMYDRKLSIQDRMDKEEEQLLKDIQTKEEMKEDAETDLVNGRKILDEMKSKRDQLLDIDKSFEKNFKKEFPGLGFNQLEALMKCFKKRPKGLSPDVDNKLDLHTRKDARQDTLSSGMSYTSRTGRDLKAKSIAAALERMSNMFRGTMLKKTPAAGVAMAMSLDELDKPAHCPENIDEESWKHLCEIRRKKIESEEKIRALDADIYETDLTVYEREKMSNDCAKDLVDAIEGLESWRKDRNYKLNNTEVVLAVTQGQLEVTPPTMTPHLQGAVLITESVITRLNQDIQRLGESKLSAMTESKDFRSGTRLLHWEKEKLTMEYEDLQAKWTEIQQTKLSKESRHALQAGEHFNRPTLAQEYAILDRAARASEEYLKNRLKQLEDELEQVRDACKAKDKENEELEAELKQIEVKLWEEREAKRHEIMFEIEDNQPQRMQRIVQRNRLMQKIKEQNDLLMGLQDQLDAYMFRSFPSLG